MGDRLQAKRALVTGAASGIGAACARRFSDEGATVTGLDLAEKPDDSGCETWVQADVADEAAVIGAVGDAITGLGGIDVLVNAAGVLSVGGADTLDEAEWERVLGVNLKGTWLVSKHVVRRMAALPVPSTRGHGPFSKLPSKRGRRGFAP